MTRQEEIKIIQKALRNEIKDAAWNFEYHGDNTSKREEYFKQLLEHIDTYKQLQNEFMEDWEFEFHLCTDCISDATCQMMSETDNYQERVELE